MTILLSTVTQQYESRSLLQKSPVKETIFWMSTDKKVIGLTIQWLYCWVQSSYSSWLLVLVRTFSPYHLSMDIQNIVSFTGLFCKRDLWFYCWVGLNVQWHSLLPTRFTIQWLCCWVLSLDSSWQSVLYEYESRSLLQKSPVKETIFWMSTDKDCHWILADNQSFQFWKSARITFS